MLQLLLLLGLYGMKACQEGRGVQSLLLLFQSTPTGGPILLEDYQLVEKLANFDRERIPERVVHARGASAKGFFEAS